MRLLVTNDDGVESAFLRELVAALRAARLDFAVVAPRHEQSWVGAAKSRSRPVRSEASDRALGCPTWIVDGTPSDCVNIAIEHLLPEPPDAVVSGINVGLNTSLGFIIASGTVAGAWEGALHGLPAVALSQDVTYEVYERLKNEGGEPDAAVLATLRTSARRAAAMIPGLVSSTPPRSFVIHNLNFPHPCREDTPVRRTVPARNLVPGLFTPQDEEGAHRLIFTSGEDVSPDGLPTDRSALLAGFISHSVLDYTKLGT